MESKIENMELVEFSGFNCMCVYCILYVWLCGVVKYGMCECVCYIVWILVLSCIVGVSVVVCVTLMENYAFIIEII